MKALNEFYLYIGGVPLEVPSDQGHPVVLFNSFGGIRVYLFSAYKELTRGFRKISSRINKKNVLYGESLVRKSSKSRYNTDTDDNGVLCTN